MGGFLEPLFSKSKGNHHSIPHWVPGVMIWMFGVKFLRTPKENRHNFFKGHGAAHFVIVCSLAVLEPVVHSGAPWPVRIQHAILVSGWLIAAFVSIMERHGYTAQSSSNLFLAANFLSMAVILVGHPSTVMTMNRGHQIIALASIFCTVTPLAAMRPWAHLMVSFFIMLQGWTWFSLGFHESEDITWWGRGAVIKDSHRDMMYLHFSVSAGIIINCGIIVWHLNCDTRAVLAASRADGHEVGRPNMLPKVRSAMRHCQCSPTTTISFLFPFVFTVYGNLYTTKRNYCIGGMVSAIREKSFHPCPVFIASHCITVFGLWRLTGTWVASQWAASLIALDLALLVPELDHGLIQLLLTGISWGINMWALAGYVKKNTSLLLVCCGQLVAVIFVGGHFLFVGQTSCEQLWFLIAEYIFIALICVEGCFLSRDGEHDGYATIDVADFENMTAKPTIVGALDVHPAFDPELGPDIVADVVRPPPPDLH